MRKFAVIMVLGLALLLMGLTLSASAVTINDPWAPNTGVTGETNLYAIVNHWLLTGFTNSGTGVGGLQAAYAAPTETLSTVGVGGI